MKTVYMTAAGGPEVLSYADAPDPHIKSPTEALVRLKAAGLNPVDVKQRGRGTWYPSTPPVILGIDGAGVVEKTGAGVKRFRPGDEVFFAHGGFGKEPGNYAEYAVVDERFLARKPKCVSFAEAAAAPSSLISAWEALFLHGKLQRGETVLIQAGAGGVGHLAVQLAREAGIRVCTTVNTEEKAELVKALGAERAIFYEKTDFVKECLEWTGGAGVDCAVDLVGGKSFFRAFSALRFYGRVVTLLGPDPKSDPKSADWTEARMRNLTVSFYLMFVPMYYGLDAHIERQAGVLASCAELLDRKEIGVHVSRTFPLREAADAHRLLEKGDTTGKIVLVMG
jgi:NADPH2:quinone reductase